MNYHYGPRRQSGRGLGSIFAALARGLAPIARLGLNAGKKIIASPLMRNLGKTALDIAKQSAVTMAADLVEGKNMKESAQNELDNARSKIAQTLRGGKKRKKHMSKQKQIKTKKRKSIKYSLLN